MTEDGINQLKVDEGFRGLPYKCSANKITIGYGRNLEANPLTKREAEILLLNDIVEAEKLAKTLAYWNCLNDVRRDVIVNMIFNLGFNGFKQFKMMNKALCDGDYLEATKQMINSRWARQVKQRAVRLAERMRTGK